MYDHRDKQGKFEEEGNSACFLSGGRTAGNKANRLISTTKHKERKTDHLSSRSTPRKSQTTFSPDPIREDRVKAARIRKQRGDYSTEEVYRKIADRLMDLFGIR